MSDAWKGVSRARKCPICQHEDWCGYWTPEDYGGELICCQRDKEKCNMIGSDGQEYVFIGSAKGSGSSIYEERTQYELLRKKKTGMNYSHISKPQKRELKPVDQIVPKNNENCSSIYTYMQNLLILDPAHKAYLHSQGWTDELIEKHHIVSFPEEDSLRVKYHNRYRTRNITRARLADLILQKFGSNSLEGIPGAYLKGEQWTFAGPSGLVFPMYDLDGNTFRLRIRKDFSDIDATVITSGQDRFYYAEGKKYFISMKGVYFVTPGGEKEFLRKKENTEPWLPTIRILRLQHVEYWPTSIKRAARLQTNAVFTAFLLPKHPPFGTSRRVSQKDYLHPTPYRLRW